MASGQKLARIQLTMCQMCAAAPAEELNHRLGIAVARALGPDAVKRAFTIENLRSASSATIVTGARPCSIRGSAGT